MSFFTADARRRGAGQEQKASEDPVIGGRRWLLGLCGKHLREGMRVFVAAVREIFDENAYERFLQRTQNARSAASYREFMRERDAMAVRRPRCC